jgi:hypothetical protein
LRARSGATRTAAGLLLSLLATLSITFKLALAWDD